ncbi:hypothetical protein [Flavobacterium sp. M31R6]|uniref:hypothetical protein n=1 Tax=Flavobacterium sp. M31R6 TaxID=2739062 RepID=UPI00156871F8|nr:hypothetical protein [Flavobacterium sp. M31R6]QKJ63345.1 hypothetical protein HQN62_09430 [Flavobacterium sp. M31R6]
MKKTIVVLVLLAQSIFVSAQDKILTHTGETIVCKVTELTDGSIKYKFEGEELINNISKNLVNEINFASGRTQKISEKVVINGESDWKKVQITNLESDIDGLKKKGEYMAKASSGWSTTGEGKMQAQAMEKLKKLAAKNGAHIVLILTITSKGGSFGFSGGTKASVTGVAYGYN